MNRHGDFHPAHAGTPQPGNPGYRQSVAAGYEGKHRGGICGLIAIPTAVAFLLGLGAVLLIVYRFSAS